MSIGMTRLCNIIHMCKQQLNMRKLKNLIGQLSNHMSNKSKLHYSLYYTYISTIILWRPGKHMYFGIALWLNQAGRGRRGFTRNWLALYVFDYISLMLGFGISMVWLATIFPESFATDLLGDHCVLCGSYYLSFPVTVLHVYNQ